MDTIHAIRLSEAFLAVWRMHAHQAVPKNFLIWYGTKFKTPIEGELLDTLIAEMVANGDAVINPNGTYSRTGE